jgi:hypothetical protein
MEGICLVDEIDLHLHPRWQAGVVRTLRAAFPRIQFIATTHSPMVLPGLRPEEIFRLEQDDEGNVIVRQAKESPALMTGSELYRRFFGIERAQPRELHDKLFEYATLASYPGRSEVDPAEAEPACEGDDPARRARRGRSRRPLRRTRVQRHRAPRS